MLDTLEGLADWGYRAAGLDSDQPAPVLELVRRLIGGGSSVPVVRCATLRTPAQLARVGAEWRIYIRARLDSATLQWLVAHELAEWILRREDYRDEDVEQLADALAARLIAPRRATQVALRAGLDFPALADAFDVTQSCALLRESEVRGTPTALVTPELVYVRGDEWAWPDAPGIRELATARRTPGLVKVRIEDAKRRTGLMVA